MFRTKSCLAWLRSWFQPRKKPVRRAQAAAAKPRLEALEDRLAPSVTPTHVYELNGSLADQLGGPALVADGGTLDATRYTFDANEGLRLTGALTDTSTYSIVMVAEIDSIANFYKKVVDFENRTADWGVYVVDANLQLYPGASGTGTVTENTDFQFVLTRDGVTGVTKIYLNGVLQQTYTGAISSVAIPSGNVLTFFEDDALTGGAEAVGGSVDRIAIYDVALTAEDIGALDNAPPIVAAADPTVVAPEGQSAINFGTWSDPNGDAVSLAASVGAVVQNANGTWSWSFATSDGPDQSRTVIITATDSTGAVSTATFNMVVTNVAPTVTRNQASVGVNEGQTAVNSGLWSDPGIDDVTLAASAGTVTKNANGTWSWSFASSDGPNQSQTVTITATDSDGSASTTTFSLVVANVAPVINTLTSNHSTFDNSSVDGNVTINGTFSDPGVLDTHTAVVNWGDGTPPQTLGVDQVGHSFTASHHYDAGGTYTISVTLTDKDGDAATQTTTAVVGGVGLIDGTLYVIATNGKDFVGIDVREGGTVLRVDARFQIGTSAYQDNVFTFAYADVHRIVINTGAGNDVVNIHNDVCIDTIILGGDGDDILQGGSAANLLVGGDGNDHLFGGSNANILIGGRGSDQLYGRGLHNLMLGGAAGIENNVAALAAALTQWNRDHSQDVLATFGPLPDDDLGRDHFHGG